MGAGASASPISEKNHPAILHFDIKHTHTHRVTAAELYLQSSLARRACDCEPLRGRWAHTGECASFARDWMEARKATSGTPSRPQLRLDIPSAAANSHSPFATFTLNHRYIYIYGETNILRLSTTKQIKNSLLKKEP